MLRPAPRTAFKVQIAPPTESDIHHLETAIQPLETYLLEVAHAPKTSHSSFQLLQVSQVFQLMIVMCEGYTEPIHRTIIGGTSKLRLSPFRCHAHISASRGGPLRWTTAFLLSSVSSALKQLASKKVRGIACSAQSSNSYWPDVKQTQPLYRHQFVSQPQLQNLHKTSYWPPELRRP